MSAMNLTALTEINVGVPPLAMVLTGLSAHLLGDVLGQVQAGLIAPVTASALTAIPAYIIARRYSRRWALLAPLMVALDPFQIQFSAAYLDSIGTLFALSSVAALAYPERPRAFAVAVAFAALSVLCKLTFLIFTTVLAVMLVLCKRMSLRQGATYALVSAASIALSPWAWSHSALTAGIEGNVKFNNVPFSSLLGPFVIGVPQSLPWYVLTYMGLGYVFWKVLPFASPFVLLIALAVGSVRKDRGLPALPAIATASAILALFLLPRNYWTYSWAGGFLQGVLSKQFYPYYFYPVGPFAATLAAVLIAGFKGDSVAKRAVTYPIATVAILSPIALVMNLGLPYWDFVFTLIYSATQGQWVVEGLIATFVTTLMLAFALLSAELLHRSFSGSMPARDHEAPNRVPVWPSHSRRQITIAENLADLT
ncbi:MAG: hypothetical protein QXP81_02195 [Nitrososphaerota archaeon]